MENDLISRQAALDALSTPRGILYPIRTVEELPSAQPERLTDDDFETIRIHLNAYKEKLCNQHRRKEAEEYQRIIDRFMGFASQPTIEPRAKGKWDFIGDNMFMCTSCGAIYTVQQLECLKQHVTDLYIPPYCPNCGADMGGEEE